MKHSKLPWYVDSQWDKRVDGYAIKSYSDVIGWTAYLGGTNLPKANAAFIVKAVNSHEILVNLLKDTLNQTTMNDIDWVGIAEALAQVEDL